MPIDFPIDPDNGDTHSDAGTTWVYSSAVNGWNQLREDWAGDIPTGITADALAEPINSDKLDLDIYKYSLGSDFVTYFSDGEETISDLTSYSTGAGLKFVFVNLNILTEDLAEATFKLKIGATILNQQVLRVGSETNFHISHVHMAAVTSLGGAFSITQECNSGFYVTARQTLSRLEFARWGS